MLVALLLRALEYHLLSEAIDRHREHQPDERAQANLVRRWDDQVQRYGAVVVHQVVDGKVARRGVLCDKRIAVQGERRLRSREDAAEVAVLFVEHFLHLLANHWVSKRLIAA